MLPILGSLYPLILLNKLKLLPNFISHFFCVTLRRQLGLFVTPIKLWCPFKLQQVEQEMLTNK